jgi:excisionase family DNA binding protein
MRRGALPFIPKRVAEPDPAPRQWLTMLGAAERLCLSPETIRKNIRDGTIAAQRFGRAVRISEAEMLRWRLKAGNSGGGRLMHPDSDEKRRRGQTVPGDARSN